MKICWLLIAFSVFPVWAHDKATLSVSQSNVEQSPEPSSPEPSADTENQEAQDVSEKICFSPAQIARGVQQIQITKDNQNTMALLLTSPVRSETVDCSSNMFAYPFLREATNSATEGVWFNQDTAEVALQLNWKRVSFPDVKRNDIVVWREDGGIAQVASINEIIHVTSNQWMVDVNIKPNSTPVLRYSFAIPQDLPKNAEVWRREQK